MKKNTIIAATAILAIGLFIYGVGSSDRRNNMMKETCKETNLFTVGDKGRLNMIYDCSGTEFATHRP